MDSFGDSDVADCCCGADDDDDHLCHWDENVPSLEHHSQEQEHRVVVSQMETWKKTKAHAVAVAAAAAGTKDTTTLTRPCRSMLDTLHGSCRRRGSHSRKMMAVAAA